MHMYQKIIAFVMTAAATAGYASAASYDELLASAVARDTELAALAIAEERAEIAYLRAVSARDAARFELAIDGIEAGSAGSAAIVSARPKARVTMPRGVSIGVEAPVAYDEDGFCVRAILNASVPIRRGPDETVTDAAIAERAWIQARWARESRRLAVEKELAIALRGLARAEASLQEAIRAEAKARRSMEEAIAIDGASSGGTALLGLERELRVKASERRAAESSRSSQRESLATLTGLLAPVSVDGLDIPAIDLDASLPSPESVPSARLAAESARIAAIDYAEAGRRVTLAATVDGSIGDAQSVVSGAASAGGSSLGAGLALEREDVEARAGLGYRFGTGPTIGGSVAWKPRPRGERSLIERDRELVLDQARAEETKELDAAARAISELEYRRRELKRNMLDLADDLRFAAEQRRVNETWLDAGIVSDTDYAEVLAFEEGAKALDTEAALDRVIWNIDRLLLSGSFTSD